MFFTNVFVVHIPYKGTALSIPDLVSGKLDVLFDALPSGMPHVRDGRLRALAVTSVERSPFAPDLPTVSEASRLKGYSAESWNGVMAPGGTPEPIMKKLSEALAKMAKDEAVMKAMAVAGASTVFTTVPEFRARIGEEMSQWRDLLKEIQDAK